MSSVRFAPLARGAAAALFSGAIAIVSLNAASCKKTTVTAAPDTGAPIKIGVSIALSGSSQGYGETVQNAIKLASQQINATGGILGRHVEFKIVDDASDTGGVIQGNVQGLLDDGVVAILGPVGSSQVLAVGDMISKRKVIQISGSATSTTLTTFQPMTDRYFFRTVPPDSLQARALAIFASRGPAAFKLGDGGSSGMAADGGPPSAGCKKMAIIYNDDDYGTPFAAALAMEFPAKSGGGTVVLQTKVPADMKANYNAEVAGVVAANPDCMAMIVYDPTADAFIRELKKGQESTPTLPPTFFIIGTDGSFTNDLISNGRLDKTDPKSPTIVEGMFGTNPDSNPETTQYGEFKNLYLTQFPLDPGANDLGPSVANFYDAAILAALAIEAAGSTDDPVKIRNALFDVSRGKKTGPAARALGPAQIGEALAGIRNGDNIDYNGASGDCNFDEFGNVVSDYIIWNVQNGQFETLAPRIKSSDLQ